MKPITNLVFEENKTEHVGVNLTPTQRRRLGAVARHLKLQPSVAARLFISSSVDDINHILEQDGVDLLKEKTE